MPETGQSWRAEFKAHPAEAHQVREWVASRLEHPDAPQVANELFLSVLSTGSKTVRMTLSTAGPRTQISAAGSVELSALHSHGPGFSIVSGLSALHGVTTDGQGLWALLTSKDVRAIIKAAEWTLGPETAEGAPRNPMYEAECASCGEQSGATEGEGLPAEVWALKHTGAHPAHRTFRAVVTSFWRVSPAEGNPYRELEAL